MTERPCLLSESSTKAWTRALAPGCGDIGIRISESNGDQACIGDLFDFERFGETLEQYGTGERSLLDGKTLLLAQRRSAEGIEEARPDLVVLLSSQVELFDDGKCECIVLENLNVCFNLVLECILRRRGGRITACAEWAAVVGEISMVAVASYFGVMTRHTRVPISSMTSTVMQIIFLRRRSTRSTPWRDSLRSESACRSTCVRPRCWPIPVSTSSKSSGLRIIRISVHRVFVVRKWSFSLIRSPIGVAKYLICDDLRRGVLLAHAPGPDQKRCADDSLENDLEHDHSDHHPGQAKLFG